jgi:hypothetical protein
MTDACDSTSAPDLMDVLFVIDATGSMSGAIKGAHDRAASMASDLHRRHHDINATASLLVFLLREAAMAPKIGSGHSSFLWMEFIGAMVKNHDHDRRYPAHGRQFCGTKTMKKKLQNFRP